MSVNDLAGGRKIGDLYPEQLFAGEAPIVTDAAPSLVAALAKYEVAALTATGVTTYVEGTHTAAQLVIVAQPITAIGQQVPFYVAGYFNNELLVWPAGLDVLGLAARKAFVKGTPVYIGNVVSLRG